MSSATAAQQANNNHAAAAAAAAPWHASREALTPIIIKKHKPTHAAVEVADKGMQLRVVRHAARLAIHERNLQLAANEIRAINAAIHTKSIAIAGQDYGADHTVTFEPCPSIAQQVDDDIGEVRGAGCLARRDV